MDKEKKGKDKKRKEDKERDKITNDPNSSHSVDTDRQPRKQEERTESLFCKLAAYINVLPNKSLAVVNLMAFLTI